MQRCVRAVGRKRTVGSMIMLATLWGTLCAHDGHEGHEPPAKLDEKIQHAPSVLPDRIVLTWAEDPAHTQHVTWRTSVDVKHGFVEFALATKGPYFVQHALRISATTAPFSSDLGDYHLHTGRMAGLAASSKYVYRVGDGNNWSEWFHFQTASRSSEPFSFIYFGDAQNNIRSMWSRVIREAYGDAPEASFMLHAGDLINSAERDAEWGEWFGGGAWVNAMLPSVATPGNHEYETKTVDEKEVRTLSKHWQPTFAFPQNGPEPLRESVYYFDYQGVRFISLNSNEQHEIQTEWLRRVLERNGNRWTIVTFHHPLFSSAVGRDNVELRKAWKPVLDEFEVDLVLQGHDHSYARSGLGLPRNLDAGMNVKRGPTVYVVSVSGPKQYGVDARPFFSRSASGAQLYQIIHVDRDELRYEARLAHGELYDAFTLRKRPGDTNALLEHVPETPESRRPLVPDFSEKFDADAFFQSHDADQDGQLTGDEIPKLIKDNMGIVDTNKDGVISRAEYDVAAAAYVN